MNRVNVMVDGTRQTTSAYRGYSGHDNRVSIDPELLSGVDISKGPNGGPFGAGIIGGVVNMRTLEAEDVVLPGQMIGTRLKLGIGTNATMFSVLSTTLIDALPFPEPDRLVNILSTQPEAGVRRGATSFLNLQDYQEQATAFETLAGVQSRSLTFSDTDEPERVTGAAVSWRLFSMLGVVPALGRDFAAADDRAGAPSVVILSDELWRRRYNADPQVVGRALLVNGQLPGEETRLDDHAHRLARIFFEGAFTPRRARPRCRASSGTLKRRS